MTHRIIVFSILVAFACCIAVFAADFNGTWTAAIESQVGVQNYTFTFKIEGEKLTGKAKSAFANAETEITEGVVIEKTLLATQTIAGLKKIGVKIFMDDFGTGYSSLSYLHRLPVDAIKIDRAFVSHMDTEDRPQQVVRTILTLVQNLGLETIAEGVTNQEQLQLLRQLGCDAAQGFLFSPPIDLASITQMLKDDPAW